MKKIILIITAACFLVSGIIMPYADFTDMRTVQFLYKQLQQQDNDMNLAEFVCDKLLVVGELFEQDDASDNCASHPVTSIPAAFQLQAGALFCTNAAEKIIPLFLPPAKPASAFKENKFSRTVRNAVFHPPVTGC
ncbi:MAG: hypothetical protein ABIQ88_12040 [Chitinophagaceae bacterium]